MLMSCLALNAKTNLVTSVTGNVHYLAKKKSWRRSSTFAYCEMDWHVWGYDVMRHNEQCTVGFCCWINITLDSGTDHASHSYVIQAYGILGLVRGISGWKRSLHSAQFISTPFGLFFFVSWSLLISLRRLIILDSHSEGLQDNAI
jgi:hypothetical protein